MNSWRQRHPERYRELQNARQRRWRASHPEEYKAKKAAQDSRTFHQFLGRCLRGRRSDDKRRKREFDIDLDYIMKLFEEQKGLCAVSGVLMTHSLYDPFGASIDRIDSTKGHVRGNIQIVCIFVQLGKARFDDIRCRELFKQVQMNLLKDLKERNLLKLSSP